MKHNILTSTQVSVKDSTDDVPRRTRRSFEVEAESADIAIEEAKTRLRTALEDEGYIVSFIEVETVEPVS